MIYLQSLIIWEIYNLAIILQNDIIKLKENGLNLMMMM